jgi:hypothetical protein
MGKKPGEARDKTSTREDPAKKGYGSRSSQHWNRHRAFKKPVILQPKFEGKCTDLKGHIYDCSDSKQAGKFTKTTKEITEYVGCTYKYGSDTRLAIENLERPILSLPDDPETDATRTETRKWEKEVDEYVRNKAYLEENLKTLYSLVWGQCTNVVQARIEALDEHKDISNRGNSIGLLKVIKALVYNFQSQKYWPLAIHDSMRHFYMIYQDKQAMCEAYLEKFQNCIDILEHCGGTVGQATGLLNMILEENCIDPKTAKLNEIAHDMKSLQEQYLAVAFPLGSDQNWYEKFIETWKMTISKDRTSIRRW